MTWWEWPLDVVVALLILALAYGACLMLRRRLIARHGGTFELSYRVRTAQPGRGWLLGVGRYSGSTLEWFRIFSISPSPKKVWQRTSLLYEGMRAAVGDEPYQLYPGHVVVACRTVEDTEVELAMSPRSLIGFQAWIESRTPGSDWSQR